MHVIGLVFLGSGARPLWEIKWSTRYKRQAFVGLKFKEKLMVPIKTFGHDEDMLFQ